MNIRKILQPISYTFQGDLRYYYYWKLLKNLKLTRDSLELLQSVKLKKLLFHAFENVHFYKEYFYKKKLSLGDIQNSTDLKYLPIISKSILNENIEKLKSKYASRLIKVTSGGSTGENSVVYKSPYFLQISRAASLRNFTIADWFPYDKSVWIWGAPYEHQQIRDSIKSKIGIFINGRLLLNAYNYSKSDFPVWVQMIKRFKPKVLYGYSSIIFEFARWCNAEKVIFEEIKSVISSTEKLQGREVIENAFQCKVHDQYGSREVLSIAIECKHGNLHVSDDTIIVEQTKEGNLLITALDSFDFPIIRYEIGDIGTKINKTCPCGLNFSLMGLEIGRITDNFIKPDGRKVSSSALATYIAALGINFKEYQIIQKEINGFEIKYVPSYNDNNDDKAKIIKALQEYFGKVDIKFFPVQKILPEQSGKRLLFKCHIKTSDENSVN